MIRLLLLACVLLLSTIAAEAVSALSAREVASDTIPSPVPGITHAAEASPAPAKDQWSALVLARPLFAPDRRPPADARGGDPTMPRLSGIVLSDNEALAIFQAADGKPVVVRRGTTINGWNVTGIVAEAVRMRKRTDEIVLRLRFADATSGPASVEPAAPSTRWEVAAAKGILRARWSNPQLQP